MRKRQQQLNGVNLLTSKITAASSHSDFCCGALPASQQLGLAKFVRIFLRGPCQLPSCQNSQLPLENDALSCRCGSLPFIFKAFTLSFVSRREPNKLCSLTLPFFQTTCLPLSCGATCQLPENWARKKCSRMDCARGPCQLPSSRNSQRQSSISCPT